MTLVVGLFCKSNEMGLPAVIVASDTQISGNVKESAHKVMSYGSLGLLVGGSGSVSLTRYASAMLSRKMKESNPKVSSCVEFDRFMLDEGEILLRNVVTSHADVILTDGFELILAFSDKNDARLYRVQADGVPFRISKDTGYTCAGLGYSLGGAVLLQQFLNEGLSSFRAARLAAYMIMAVHVVDGSVGETPEIFQTNGGIAGRFKEPAEETVKNRVTIRAGSLAYFWKFLDSHDASFEAKASVALQKKEYLSKIKHIIDDVEVDKPATSI